jgi:hypothetical protein
MVGQFSGPKTHGHGAKMAWMEGRTLQKYFYTPIGLIQKRKRISYDSLGRGVDDEHEIS